MEFPFFLNSPFPLEYPAVAPFYTNVDTTDANETTSITFFQSTDGNLLKRVSNLVQDSFVDEYEFEAVSVFVATWQNVGHFNRNNNQQNTFEVFFIIQFVLHKSY